MAFVPRSALVANGRWRHCRNGDLVGQLLDPAGGDTPGQPGQYRQLAATPGSTLVEIKQQTTAKPWRPRIAPSIKPSDMAHLMSEKDYAKGRWSGRIWTHVRYAVSFVDAGQESFVGPWSSWLGFAADNVIMPRIHDLPVDEDPGLRHAAVGRRSQSSSRLLSPRPRSAGCSTPPPAFAPGPQVRPLTPVPREPSPSWSGRRLVPALTY